MNKINRYYYQQYVESDNIGKFIIAIGFESIRKDMLDLFGITLEQADIMSIFDIEEFMEEHGEEITKMFEKEINK